MLPAHYTKHVPELDVKIGGSTFRLNQSDKGDTNGTALWLGGQLLSVYLLSLHGAKRLSRAKGSNEQRMRVIELGSGIGLCGLTLASLGCDVLATDVPPVLELLRHNVEQNVAALPWSTGRIDIRELNWTVLPESWTWNNPSTIATHGTVAENSASAHVHPHFDLVITADTLYQPTLTQPLLRSLHHLINMTSSSFPPTPDSSSSRTRCYVALERRDPALIDAALNSAQEEFGFACDRVPPRKLAKAMKEAALNWEKDDWDGVEIWELSLPNRSA